MSVTPAGWYDDPYPGPYGPGGLRWWDGSQWSEHVAPRPGPPVGAVPTTPDGEVLAGWGRRLAAYLLDGLVLGVLTLLVSFPFVARLVHAFADYVHATVRAQESGAPPPSQLSIYSDQWGAILGIGLVSLLVNLVYQLLFLRWRSATPGKLALGLRVRLREQPGQLSWATILRRWLAQFGPNVIALVPLVGSLASVYQLVDGLWPLGDRQRQAVHDKFAGTNVVRRR